MPHGTPPQQHQGMRPQRPPREPRYRFRWEVVWILGALFLTAWFLNHIQPVFAWADIVDWLGVPYRSRERVSQVTVLGIAIVAILLIAMNLRKR